MIHVLKHFIVIRKPNNYSSGSQLGPILFPTGHLAVSEDIVSRHNCVYAGIYWVEIQDAQHPTMHSQLQQRRIIGPKYQEC